VHDSRKCLVSSFRGVLARLYHEGSMPEGRFFLSRVGFYIFFPSSRCCFILLLRVGPRFSGTEFSTSPPRIRAIKALSASSTSGTSHPSLGGRFLSLRPGDIPSSLPLVCFSRIPRFAGGRPPLLPQRCLFSVDFESSTGCFFT